MSQFRMCRWHDCEAPDYQNEDQERFKVPSCKSCGKFPPIKELIPKLNAKWQPNHIPPDEKMGEMNLHWPESVFGKRKKTLPSTAILNSDVEAEKTFKLDVYGDSWEFERVDLEPLTASQIRLMRLSPIEDHDVPVVVSLESHEDDNTPEYEAVSYSLGGQNRNTLPEMPIYVGKQRDIMLLTETCESMLRFLSPRVGEHSGLLWFDYLCINQRDMVERDHQLPKMGFIYGLCNRVIVYLGNDIVQKLSKGQHRSRYWLHEIDGLPCSTATNKQLTLNDVLEREYFKRTWVIQEILLAENVVLPIGQYDFRAGIVGLNRLAHAKRWDWATSQAPWLQYMGQTSVFGGNLYKALHQTRRTHVTDKRDQIYGILGLVQNDTDFKPDSSLSWKSIYIGTCAHLIKRGHFELLFTSVGSKAPREKLSWLPDWAGTNIWAPMDSNILESIKDFNKRNESPIDKDWFHFICHWKYYEPELWSKHFGLLSLCASTGALCLKLNHLLTLKSKPRVLDTNDSLTTFMPVAENANFIITTLNGPLDQLEPLDEIFLLTGPYNQPGILFALQFQKQRSYRLLFACACIEAMFMPEIGRGLRYPLIYIWENFRGITYKYFPEEGLPRLKIWTRILLGGSLSSILHECRDILEGKNQNKMELEDPKGPGREGLAFKGMGFATPLFNSDSWSEFDFSMDIPEGMVSRLVQARLDDEFKSREEIKNTKDFNDSAWREHEGQTDKTDLGIAFQKVLRELCPGCTVTMEDDDFIVRSFPEGSRISTKKDWKHHPILEDWTAFQFHELVKVPDERDKRGMEFDFTRSGISSTWKLQSIKFSRKVFSFSPRHEIVYRCPMYPILKRFSGFRRQTGLKEIELFEQIYNYPSEYDSLYPDFDWPFGQETIDELGLVGEMKDVRIE